MLPSRYTLVVRNPQTNDNNKQQQQISIKKYARDVEVRKQQPHATIFDARRAPLQLSNQTGETRTTFEIEITNKNTGS